LTENQYGVSRFPLVSPEEFESWKETLDIKTNADLMEEIKKGIAALKENSKLYSLEELFK
jgi:PHD/YefM family antitoxin component YafN of YafNO toxin-antitoxin module